MSEQPERSFKAMSWPGTGGNAGNAAVGVAAPVGAVSRKDRERAARTALEIEALSRAVLLSELPGTVALQRRAADGDWETLSTEPTDRTGRTPIVLPSEGPSGAFRVVFSPKNPNIPSWVSTTIDA
jgi:hypothetical protein